MPDIRHILISVNRLDKAYKITFSNGRCHISDKDGQAIAEAYCKDGLYRLRTNATNSRTKVNLVATTTTESIPMQRWHERLGHIHKNAIRQLSRQADNIAIANDTSVAEICKSCLEGKQH